MTPERKGIISSIFSYWREIMIISLFLFSISCLNKIGETKEIKQEEIIEYKWTGFDSLSFKEAFSQMYTEHGPGHVFDWRGNVFLTKLAE